MKSVIRAKDQRLLAKDRPHDVRQGLGLGHILAVDQDWNDTQIVGQSEFDLLPNEIVRVPQPRPLGPWKRLFPIEPDQRQEHARRLQGLPDSVVELLSRFIGVAIALAYLSNLLFVTFVYAVGAAEPIWGAQQEAWWREYFFASGRILLASSITFLIVGFLDVMLFAWLKRLAQRFEQRASAGGLAASAVVRSAASDAFSMTADSILFAVLAFAFTMPWDDLATLILGSLGLKMMLAVIDTP